MTFGELANAIVHTLAVVAIAVPVALGMGVLLAMLLVRSNAVARRGAWIAIGSQLAIPLYVFAGGWSAAFGYQGWFTSMGLRPWIFWDSGQLNALGALVAASLLHALASLPWVVLILALGLLRTDRRLEDQAWLDGGIIHVWRRAILPRLRVWLAAAAVWVMVPIMTEMVITNLYQVPTVPEQIYLDASRGSVRPVTYLAAFLICLTPAFVILYLVVKSLPAWQVINDRDASVIPHTYDLGWWRWLTSIGLWALVLLIVGLPIASLVAKAGWQPFVTEDGRTTYGWTPQRFFTTCYESLFLFQTEFYWSGVLAVLSSSIALATAAGLFASLSASVRRLISGFMLLTLAFPGPLVGMLVIFALNRSQPELLGILYDRTLAAPIVAQQFRLLPLAWLLVWVMHASISQSSWRLARLDGLGRWEIGKYIILPQFGRGLLAAWLLLFVLSFGELSCSILVLPPGVTTVSMRLFEMLHFGMRHQDSGLCGVLILLGWVVSLALWKTLKDR